MTHANLFSVNAGFIISDGQTVIVDAGFNVESAMTIYNYAYHFKKMGCQIMSHESVHLTGEELEIPRRKRNRKGYLYFEGVETFEPDIKIKEKMHLEIAGTDITIYPAPGYTPSNLMLYEAREKVIYAADTIYSGFLPTMGFGHPDLWRAWLEALDLIESLQPEVLVLGHGKVLKGAEITAELHRQMLKERLDENETV